MRFREFINGLVESDLEVDPQGLPSNYFSPSQDFPVRQPLPDVSVDLPDQYRADRNVLIYDGMIWNAMTAPVYRAMQKSPAVFDREIVPAGKIKGISGQIMIAQHKGVNYFLTNDMARNLQQEVKTADLANRNRSVQSRMARGERLSAMPTGEIDGTKPTAGTTDRGSVRDPEQQFDLPARRA